MQNTITARRISYNLVALIVLLVTVALLVGFSAGFAVSRSSSALIGTTLAQPIAPTAGWVYHRDSLTNKWYAYHYSTTPSGPVIDETYEISGSSGRAADGCGLDLAVEC